MKAILYSNENKVLLTIENIVSYNERAGEIEMAHPAFGKGVISNLDFTTQKLALFSGETLPQPGDDIDPSTLEDATSFKVVPQEQTVEELQLDSAHVLMQLSMATMDANVRNAEIAQLREEVAMLTMVTAMKGGL